MNYKIPDSISSTVNVAAEHAIAHPAVPNRHPPSSAVVEGPPGRKVLLGEGNIVFQLKKLTHSGCPNIVG